MSIPVSVVYTSDPNVLDKQTFVRGFVGVSYDFVPIIPFIPVESIELTSTSESIISN